MTICTVADVTSLAGEKPQTTVPPKPAKSCLKVWEVVAYTALNVSFSPCD